MIHASSILERDDLDVDPTYEDALQDLLVACRTHLPVVDEDRIRRAFAISYWAHRNDWRASGERYVSHPLAVARIVAEDIGLDDMSVAAALLHDVVEDTEVSLDFIREEFGETMETIIDGLTKISGVFSSRELGQAENVRKLMLSMAADLRVILVKFADRLHNMRTIEALPREKQLRKASETMELFAPLAHRFGLYPVKSEMEDLSLKVLDPDAYHHITAYLERMAEEREAYIHRFIEPLRDQLTSDGFTAEIYGRVKNITSIHRKMKRQNKPLDEIYDIFAIRIVLDGDAGKEDCWRVYSIVTDLYKPLPERFRDFISVPKGNGYQSLHTTVLGPGGRRVEVQIRTREMHEVAEKGVAAHWKYKEGKKNVDEEMEQFLEWVRDLLENPKPEQATEFVKEFRLNLYDEEIYVFTPKGDLMTLPRGATPVDFAFKVHTEVGMQCIGAKVNGKMVPLSHELQSGDQVEVITSKKQRPNPDWINFVVTHKARSQVRHWANEERRKTADLGREIWEKKASRARIEISDQDLQDVAHELKFPDLQQLFYEIGSGLYDPEELIDRIKNGPGGETPTDDGIPDEQSLRERYEKFLDAAKTTGQQALLIDGELQTDIAVNYASCCNPIPGDEVFGFVSKSGTINIHRSNCGNAPDLLSNHPDRILDVDWSRQKDVQFISALRIMGEDRVAMVNDITTVISKNLKTNIRSITIDSEDGIFSGTVVLHVSDLEHLRRLMERLKRIDGIHGVYRFEE
ncbi:RelA/SpoT family protein [Salisaeta longa]|uniref:RelA/SpoT family protein n=1 Tax=Salisaeta longa TaxID=503170 RepID=UPI0003B5D90F|nr:bifunctional (p)ppGpp synthetase/guanosine-3',5'-bis(diphosphate) 3'-pyrophosphohydrolase [Salisaeta longa]